MGKAFYSFDDARMRLDRTICMYRGEPWWVIFDGKACYISKPWDTSVTRMVDYTESEFNYKHISLGYLQSDKEAVYLTRIPDRRQKQGLTLEAISIIGNRPHEYQRNFFNTKSMENCILGKHKTIKEAFNLIYNERYKGVAIARTLAIKIEERERIELHYRGRCIGIKNHTEEFLIFPSKDSSIIQKYLIENEVQFRS